MSGLFGSSPKVEQPQATAALTIQQSSYGTPVPLLYGANRVYGNLIWYGDFYSQPIQQQGAGGKGGVVGGGGKGGGSSSYQYWASFAIGLCEGVINSIGAVYVSKQISSLATLGGQLFTGTQGQSPWGYLSTHHPDQALSYSELSYVAFAAFSLGTSTETPQFSFEAFSATNFGGFQDCRPDQFFIDFLARAGMDAGNIGSFTACATYWQAIGFFISPYIDQQNAARDWCKQIMDTLNSEFVWYPSQGYLDAVPYGDTAASGNDATFTPNLTPIYSIGDDDYIRANDNEDPVTCSRPDMSDVYNQFPIEYRNRADQYNVETYTAYDDALVDEFGFRTGSTLSAHHFTDPNVAQQSAKLYLNRQVYVRNTYSFKLPWNYILLDPMDIIAINDANLGLVNQLVRIIDIQIEDEGTNGDGVLSFNVEEVPNAIAGAALFPSFGTSRSTPNYNIAPGNINEPVFFESPLAFLQASQVEVDIGISGQQSVWGGCDVWVSTDGVTYKFLTQFNSKSRMGILTANLANFTPPTPGNNIDTSNTLSIDMSESSGVLNNAATNQDALLLNTLCYVDGELMAFGSDNLTGTNKYDLTYLNRGAYGTEINSHASGSNFVMFDQNVLKYEVDQTRVGHTLYFKFLSYNAWGGGQQTLDEVPAYPYIVTGSALLTPLANIANLETNYFGDIAQLNWDAVADIRSPIFYEIRKGTSFDSGQVIGRTPNTNFRVTGSGTYWVSALYITPLGVNVYSSSPPSIAIVTPTLTQNVLGSYNEAPAWTGTKTNCSIVGSNLVTTAGQASATYTAPTGHKITTNCPVSARVTVNWDVAASNPASDIVSITDITAVPDITFASVQGNVTTQPQIKLDGGVWQNWSPGVYTFSTSIEFQIVINISDTTYQAVISGFSFEVDVDDLFQNGTTSSSASADTNVTFAVQFNTVPVLNNPTILNPSSGDEVLITAGPTTTGFSYKVLNSGSRVARNLTYQAQGY